MEFTISNLNCTPELGAFPRLKLDVGISSKFRFDKQKNNRLIMMTVKLVYQGFTVCLSDPVLSGQEIGNGMQLHNNTFYFILDREKIRAIEQTRVDDIIFGIAFEFLYSYYHEDKPNQVLYDKVNEYKELNFSQKQWNAALHAFGFNNSWIIEIPRTNIEGFSEIMKHLEKADEDFYINNYAGCMLNLRAAWKSLKPLIDTQWDAIANHIDLDSPGQQGYDLKSKRILELKNRIADWSNIGAHGEAYKLNPEDAILCYYQSLSMIAYLGQVLKLGEMKK